MKDELQDKIMTEIFTLRRKTNSYLINGGDERNKEKGRQKCVIKRRLKFKDHK